MNSTLPTPISVLEAFFDRELISKDLRFWDDISDDRWVDFAKTYRAQMKSGFTHEALAKHIEEEKIRLHFDYVFYQNYDREISRRYAKTPLLGLSPYPADNVNYHGDGLAQALAPLYKHLLVADEVYVPDNFYRCFDAVADSYGRYSWRSDPNVEASVRRSVAAILQWLPILAGLRDLIVSGAINFFPYYKVPSFPYDSTNTFIIKQMARLEIPPDPGIKSIDESGGFDLSRWDQPPQIAENPETYRLDCESTVCAWLNARLLGLDPVFAETKSWQWASGIKFRDETKAQLTTDLMSIDILPLGTKKSITVADIVSMRKEERTFAIIRETLSGCKDYVSQNISETASKEFISNACRQYIRDHLDPEERLRTIKFLDNNLIAGTVLSVAIGAAFLTANPLVGLLAPAALTPKTFLTFDRKINPKIRAAVQLEAIL